MKVSLNEDKREWNENGIIENCKVLKGELSDQSNEGERLENKLKW